MLIATSITFFYCLLVLTLVVGWWRSVAQKNPPETEHEQFISVIIPVRNEKHNITRLRDSLLAQDYTNYQIIFIDDHSTDNTLTFIQSLADPRIHVYPNIGHGKKKAITQGVSRSEGSIVVTTDADCTHASSWLKSINRYFQQGDVVLLAGPVVMGQNKSIFSNMQSIEFASLIGSAAATTALGIPTMCNGANLAYRKEVFEAVNGYEGNDHIPSGDDEFLMRKILNKFEGRMRFATMSEAIVTTEAQPNLSSFFSQRVRWASKWKHNSSISTILLAIFIVISQIATIVCFFLLTSVSILPVVALICKFVVEFIFLFSVCRFFKIRWHWLAFLLLQILYPFYVVFTGLASNFWSYSWKQRKSSDPVL
jgi:poly-beta-1,6-N-acetyl-D-glucosamine synthase